MNDLESKEAIIAARGGLQEYYKQFQSADAINAESNTTETP